MLLPKELHAIAIVASYNNEKMCLNEKKGKIIKLIDHHDINQYIIDHYLPTQ